MVATVPRTTASSTPPNSVSTGRITEDEFRGLRLSSYTGKERILALREQKAWGLGFLRLIDGLSGGPDWWDEYTELVQDVFSPVGLFLGEDDESTEPDYVRAKLVDWLGRIDTDVKEQLGGQLPVDWPR